MKQIGREFLIFVSSLVLSLAFISCSYSISSTSAFLWFLYLLSFCSAPACLQYAPVNGRLWARDVLTVVFVSGSSPCHSPLLHIKQAALGALSSSLDTTCQLGGRVDRLASNFQTQRLSPGDLPLPPSLSVSLPPSSPTSHSWAFLFSTHSPSPLTSAKASKACSGRATRPWLQPWKLLHLVAW